MIYAAIAFVLLCGLGLAQQEDVATHPLREGSIRAIKRDRDGEFPAAAISISRAYHSAPTREVSVGGFVRKPGQYERIENESLAALIDRIGGIPASQAELERFRRGEQVSLIRISIYRNGIRREFTIDPKSNELRDFILMDSDVIVVARPVHIEGFEYPVTIILERIEVVEQAGTGQPATRSESNSEGSDKPQPESEGRSR